MGTGSRYIVTNIADIGCFRGRGRYKGVTWALRGVTNADLNGLLSPALSSRGGEGEAAWPRLRRRTALTTDDTDGHGCEGPFIRVHPSNPWSSSAFCILHSSFCLLLQPLLLVRLIKPLTVRNLKTAPFLPFRTPCSQDRNRKRCPAQFGTLEWPPRLVCRAEPAVGLEKSGDRNP